MKFTYERAGKVVVGMIMFCLSAFILVMMALSDGQYIQKAFGMSENSIFYSFFAGIQNARTGQIEVEYLGMPLAMLVYKVLSFAMPSYLIGLPVEDFRFTQQANIVCVGFMFLCFAIFACLTVLSRKKVYITWILLAFLFSLPGFTIINDGGMGFLTLIFLMIFLDNYQSENKALE